MSVNQTEIHDTHTCPCEMCGWAQETAANKPKSPPETYYGYLRLDGGVDLAVGSAGNPPPDPQHLFRGSEGVVSLQTPNSTISAPTFTEEWELAPRAMRNYTEKSIAEYWFLRGVRAGEVAATIAINGDLKELRRVAAERIEQR